MNCTKTMTTKTGIFAVVAAGAMVSAVAATCSFPDAPFEMPPIPVAKFADRDFSIADFGAREGIKATDAFAAAMAARGADPCKMGLSRGLSSDIFQDILPSNRLFCTITLLHYAEYDRL